MGYCWTRKLQVHHPLLLPQRHRGLPRLRHHQVALNPFRKETFDHLKEWLEEVKANGNVSMQVLLVGNKTDLEAERQVSTEEGRLFAQKEDLTFIEISAKDYKKVEGAFNVLA